MINNKLWLSFEFGLKEQDVEIIENRLNFLRDFILEAINRFPFEEVSSDLDLNLHIYLKYFEVSGVTNLSSWLMHDSWFFYYSDGQGASEDLMEKIKYLFGLKNNDLLLSLNGISSSIDLFLLVRNEADAVIWLSFLDYLVVRLIEQIGQRRMQCLLR